jgi:hypothetical protein
MFDSPPTLEGPWPKDIRKEPSSLWSLECRVQKVLQRGIDRMSDITERIYEYRECVRGLWNNFLRPAQRGQQGQQGQPDFDAVDRFRIISQLLFNNLVLQQIGMQHFSKAAPDDPYPFLNLEPTTDPFPVMVARAGVRGYWDDPTTLLSTGSTALLFMDFFDWDQFNYIDLQYYRALITRCDERPELIGRLALVDIHQSRVLSANHHSAS